jgi:hypothetical protein
MEQLAVCAPADRQSYSIEEICCLYHISRARLYQLWAVGKGPTSFKSGTRTLIAREDAEAWDRRRRDIDVQQPVAKKLRTVGGLA